MAVPARGPRVGSYSGASAGCSGLPTQDGRGAAVAEFWTGFSAPLTCEVAT